jgi:hypothetical protein
LEPERGRLAGLEGEPYATADDADVVRLRTAIAALLEAMRQVVNRAGVSKAAIITALERAE